VAEDALVRDILIVAYKLALLTFYIGVLVYALPIPVRSVKRWAPILLWDAILAALVSLLFFTLVDISNEIAALLGGSWAFFTQWRDTAISVLMLGKTIILAVMAVLSRIGYWGYAKFLVSPLDKAIDTGLFTVFWIAAVAYFVKKFGLILAAIGSALYAVPFRITRSAGAVLLSFFLVANAGFQVMPAFMSAVAEAPGRPDPGKLERYGLAVASIEVVDYRGQGVSGQLLMSLQGVEGPVALVEVVGGLAMDPVMGTVTAVPSKASTYYHIVIDGVYFRLYPYPVNPSDYDVDENGIWHVKLSNSNMVWIDDYIVFFTNASIASIEEEGNTTIITVYSPASVGYASIRYPDSCALSVQWAATNVSLRRWAWAGISGLEERASFTGTLTVEVTVYSCDGVNPDFRKRSYLGWAADLGSFTDLHLVAAYMLYYVTVPVIYMFLMLSATASLARLLGGRGRIPVKV